ncbi:MAG: hypothetical protein JWN86_2551, partial [Planctomycetota bacterium]|nr:hypothetical protein [Planctomycetota bacterium]
RTFDVDLRRVKAARQELVHDGWLLPDHGDDQAAMNRWGRAYSVNPQWREPEGHIDLRQTPPRDEPGLDLPPPKANREPLPRSGNQEPDAAGGDGVIDRKRAGERPPRPDLRRVRPEDLRDTGRILELHRQAVAQGLVTESESDRLKILAAAAHATTSGTRNPPGLFATMVREQLWRNLTSSDDESGARRLKVHLHGVGPQGVPRPRPDPGPPRRSLSADAELIRVLRARLAGRGDPYLILRRASSAWTRERYERGVVELDAAGVAARSPSAENAGGMWSLGSVLGRLGLGNAASAV